MHSPSNYSISNTRHFEQGGLLSIPSAKRCMNEIEHAMARFMGSEAAMAVNSGYLANLIPLTALFGKDDLIISDERNHQSLLDSFKLTGAEVQIFPHNNMEALENILKYQYPSRRILIVSKGAFSRDGDRCPLPELVRLKQEYKAFLMIEEAYSIGVSGSTGRGTHEHYGMPASAVDIWTGSLPKAISSNGGFIAGDAALIYYLQQASSLSTCKTTPSSTLSRKPQPCTPTKEPSAFSSLSN